MGIRIIKSSDTAVRDVLRGRLAANDVRRAVADTIADVERRGDQAVIDATKQLENVDLSPQELRVDCEAIAAAHAAADDDFLGLIRRAAANIRQYQQGILVKSPPALNRGGRRLSVRYTPIDRVAVYVPGGRALYPSTVLMTVVPAQVAGVEQIAMLSPPTAGGDIHPTVLALAGELGVTEVYRASGTAGIAALAIGTKSIASVNKIVGPGNAFIAEAKRQLFGRVGIDSIAGPSEVLIVADQTADAAWVAADMLAQAEHDPGSAVLVTTSEKLAVEVEAAIEMQIAALAGSPGARTAAIRTGLSEYSAIIVVPDMAAACELANDFAAEHLQIVTADDEAVLGAIRNAGAIFLGPHTPVSLGDYYAGPSHVLPTGATARFFSPLSCNDFQKASSVVRYSSAALAEDAADVEKFATVEGLTAHAEAVRIRRR